MSAELAYGDDHSETLCTKGCLKTAVALEVTADGNLQLSPLSTNIHPRAKFKNIFVSVTLLCSPSGASNEFSYTKDSTLKNNGLQKETRRIVDCRKYSMKQKLFWFKRQIRTFTVEFVFNFGVFHLLDLHDEILFVVFRASFELITGVW